MQWNDLIGRQLGQYEIIEELGRGGSARVYRAYQDSMQRYVAVKVLLNDSEDRLGFVRRFEREVEVVAQLSHPNIVAVYDAGQYEDLIYLVMQCVIGGTLRQRLGQPMDVGEACEDMIQMARALHHAHARGIVHRDVKPSNMLINAEEGGRLLLTDFGIAKLHGMRGLTKSGTTVGTPEYMAPEQAESSDTDARADVYSLGCVLYEALAGRPPFVGTTPVSVLYQQVHSRPDYIRGLNPKVPRELARVIDMALAKRPDERFPTAESFALALHPFTEAHERAANSVPLALRGVSADLMPAELDLRRSSRPLPQANGSGEASAPMSALPADAGLVGVPGASDPIDVPRGLGTEGLDALFPEDPEAFAARSQQHPSGAAGERAPSAPVARSRTGGPRPTIPLPAFRLPSLDNTTRPLDLPLTSGGQLDIEALMAQVEERPTVPPGLPAPAYQGLEGYADLPGYDPRQLNPPVVWHHPEHTPAELRAALTGPLQMPGDAPPIWRPEDTVAPPAKPQRRASGSRRSRLLIAVGALVVVLAVAVSAWLVLNAGGTGLSRQAPTPVPTATAVVAPTVTPTPSPAATATPTQQQILDRQAAAAFRRIIVAAKFDGTCATANNKASFAAGQSIYVNLCVAASASSGQVSIALRQGGSTFRQLTRNTTMYPDYWYGYSTYGLSAGTYDVLVTFNGGTAADLAFTVQ